MLSLGRNHRQHHRYIRSILRPIVLAYRQEAEICQSGIPLPTNRSVREKLAIASAETYKTLRTDMSEIIKTSDWKHARGVGFTEVMLHKGPVSFAKVDGIDAHLLLPYGIAGCSTRPIYVLIRILNLSMYRDAKVKFVHIFTTYGRVRFHRESGLHTFYRPIRLAGVFFCVAFALLRRMAETNSDVLPAATAVRLLRQAVRV